MAEKSATKFSLRGAKQQGNLMQGRVSNPPPKPGPADIAARGAIAPSDATLPALFDGL
jgi:hypothetical protein